MAAPTNQANYQTRRSIADTTTDLRTTSLIRQSQKPEGKQMERIQNFQSVRKLSKKFRGAEDFTAKSKMLNLD